MRKLHWQNGWYINITLRKFSSLTLTIEEVKVMNEYEVRMTSMKNDIDIMHDVFINEMHKHNSLITYIIMLNCKCCIIILSIWILILLMTWWVVDPINDTMTFNDTITSNCSIHPKKAIWNRFTNQHWQSPMNRCQFHCHLQHWYPKECPCF